MSAILLPSKVESNIEFLYSLASSPTASCFLGDSYTSNHISTMFNVFLLPNFHTPSVAVDKYSLPFAFFNICCCFFFFSSFSFFSPPFLFFFFSSNYNVFFPYQFSFLVLRTIIQSIEPAIESSFIVDIW